MSTKFSSGRTLFDFSFSPAASAKRVDPEAPFCLGILGDFSGRGARTGSGPTSGWRFRQIDTDNFEKVMELLGVKLRLTLREGTDLELSFSSLEDFHPDRLVRQIAPLAKLCEQRKRLLQPTTAAAAASELRGLLAMQSKAPAQPSPAAATASESEAETLARLLGGPLPKPAPAPSSGARAAVENLLRSAVGASAVPDASAHDSALLSLVDLELCRLLRNVLHHPEFQALEATWRGIDLLVRGFGGEENIKLFLLDIPKAELIADLKAQSALDASALWRALRQQNEELPWAAWCGLFPFDDSVSDLETLAGLATFAESLRAPFLGAASSHLAGCDSFGLHPDPDDWNRALAADVQNAWQALRGLPQAAYLGLALPRFLLRQPYGKDSDPVEAFPFQELDPDATHEQYLWGNPGIACAYLLAAAFQAEGWDFQIQGYGEVTDLPVYQFSEDGETKVKPCAEAWLSDRAGERLLAMGLIPLLSVKGRDAVRLPELQSLAGKGLQLR